MLYTGEQQSTSDTRAEVTSERARQKCQEKKHVPSPRFWGSFRLHCAERPGTPPRRAPWDAHPNRSAAAPRAAADSRSIALTGLASGSTNQHADKPAPAPNPARYLHTAGRQYCTKYWTISHPVWVCCSAGLQYCVKYKHISNLHALLNRKNTFSAAIQFSR